MDPFNTQDHQIDQRVVGQLEKPQETVTNCNRLKLQVGNEKMLLKEGTNCTPFAQDSKRDNSSRLENVPQNNIRKLKDSGIPWIGLIPEEWEIIRHKNVFMCSKEIIGKDWKSTQLLSLTTKGIKCIEASQQTGKVPDDYGTYQKVDSGNIVICLFDLDCSAVFAGISLVQGMISPAYKVLKVNSSTYAKFLDYYFQFIFNGRKFKYLSKNIRYSLTYDEFSILRIPVPPLEEQERIAAWLDAKCGEIDELIEVEQQMISELEAYRQAVITEAVTHGLNPDVNHLPTNIDSIGWIPSNWTIGKFGRYASVMSNLVHPIDYPDYPQLSSENIIKNSNKLLPCKTVKEAGVISDNHLFFKGQIVYSKIRPLLNKVIIAPFDGLCSADMYPIDTSLHKRFMLYYMLSHAFTHQVATITQDRVKMPKINKEELSTISIVVPPLSEQKEISNYLDTKCVEIDDLIKVKQEKIETLKQYRQSLIFEAVTGKITIN